MDERLANFTREQLHEELEERTRIANKENCESKLNEAEAMVGKCFCMHPAYIRVLDYTVDEFYTIKLQVVVIMRRLIGTVLLDETEVEFDTFKCFGIPKYTPSNSRTEMSLEEFQARFKRYFDKFLDFN